jgi:TonB family protein
MNNSGENCKTVNPGENIPRIITLFLFVSISFCSSKPLTVSYYEFRQKSDTIYNKAEKMPLFDGKEATAFSNWIAKEIKYPSEALKQKIIGCVTVTFVVEKDGTLSYVKVLKSVPTLDEEAVRVIKSSPKWTPGMNSNTPVRVSLTMPVFFETTFPIDANIKKLNPPELR